MSPSFSIIIPVYNVAPYLRECLDSVLAQTFTDWEAICVDDGSTDGSGAILDEYAECDPRFRVIHQTNSGVSAARNNGIEHATGEWISFVDSDDYVTNDYLSGFAELENVADLNFFEVEAFDNENGQTYRYGKNDCGVVIPMTDAKAKSLYKRAFSRGLDTFGWTCNKFVKRSIVRAIRFENGIKYFEDELFWLAVCENISSFRMLKYCPYRYRMRKGGLTNPESNDLMGIAGVFMQYAKRSKYKYLTALAHRRALTFVAQSKKNLTPFQRFTMKFRNAGALDDWGLIWEYRMAILNGYMRRHCSIMQPFAKMYRRIMKHGEFAV